jgi:hypothetical protein
MIALCRPHHDAADAGVFSKQQIQELKKQQRTSSAEVDFPWAPRSLLIRVGGCYCGGTETLVAIGGKSCIRIRRAETGLLLLSLKVDNVDGANILEVEDNMLLAQPAELHDLEVNTSATKVRVWFADRKIGLDLSFKRMTAEQLSDLLKTDLDRSNARRDERLSSLKLRLGDRAGVLESTPESREAWLASLSNPLPDAIRSAIISDDQVGDLVKEWARNNCRDDEGLVAVLNFKQLSLYGHGRHVQIEDGVRSDGLDVSYSTFFDQEGAFGL